MLCKFYRHPHGLSAACYCFVPWAYSRICICFHMHIHRSCVISLFSAQTCEDETLSRWNNSKLVQSCLFPEVINQSIEASMMATQRVLVSKASTNLDWVSKYFSRVYNFNTRHCMVLVDLLIKLGYFIGKIYHTWIIWDMIQPFKLVLDFVQHMFPIVTVISFDQHHLRPEARKLMFSDWSWQSLNTQHFLCSEPAWWTEWTA